ncbi:MAG: hypothetical protein V1495_02010 [Pseudomonadota bacterium]
MKTLRWLTFGLFGIVLSCGGGTIEFGDVVSIPAGNAAGNGYTATYTVRVTITSAGCANVAALDVPVVGKVSQVDVVVTQEDGALTLASLDSVTLRGGIQIDSRFEVGGAAVVTVEGADNILRMVHLNGNFTDATSFKGTGEERMTGRISTQDVDCTFSFSVDALQKPA